MAVLRTNEALVVDDEEVAEILLDENAVLVLLVEVFVSHEVDGFVDDVFSLLHIFRGEF